MDLTQRSLQLRNKNRLREIKKERFIQNLMLRSAGRPIKKQSTLIELSRRIMQLILLLYKNPLAGRTIKNLLQQCYRKRQAISKIRSSLNNSEINEEQFIIFCYWYLKSFPVKMYSAFGWVIHEAVFALGKYKAEPDLWKKVYAFANDRDRGRKLIKLVRVISEKREEDKTYDRLRKM